MIDNFRLYDDNAERTLVMEIGLFNSILHGAGAKISVVRRSEELKKRYSEYLSKMQEHDNIPEEERLTLSEYENAYFNCKCAFDTELNTPANKQLIEALDVKDIQLEWTMDYYGNYNTDQITIKYRI